MAVSSCFAVTLALIQKNTAPAVYITANAETNHEEWKQAYEKFLNQSKYISENGKDKARFMLAYIDEDDIPELAIAFNNGFKYDKVGLVIYSDLIKGSIADYKPEEFGTFGEFTYSEKQNIFVYQSVWDSINTHTICSINNGTVKSDTLKYDAKDLNNVHYYFNDKEITEYEYNKQKDYYDNLKSSLYYDNMKPLNDENISLFIYQFINCGDNAYATFNKATETFTISGTGDIEKDCWLTSPCWQSPSEFYNVIIEDGITSIGKNSFYCCEGLKEIKLPNSLENIQQCAFFTCSSLTELTVPSSVQNIENLCS